VVLVDSDEEYKIFSRFSSGWVRLDVKTLNVYVLIAYYIQYYDIVVEKGFVNIEERASVTIILYEVGVGGSAKLLQLV